MEENELEQALALEIKAIFVRDSSSIELLVKINQDKEEEDDVRSFLSHKVSF